MKKTILLIQFRTDVSALHEVDCMKSLIGEAYLEVVNMMDDHPSLPKSRELSKYSGVITGGSGQFNVSDWPDDVRVKIERLKPLLAEIVQRDFPLLSICFGHQLLALWFGGTVEADPEQAESGSCEVHLNEQGEDQNIFKDIPKDFYAVLGHKDTVTKLPEGAILLAKSAKCSVEAYKIKNNIYSVQFHPELDKEGVIYRMTLYPSYGKINTLDAIKKNFHEIPHAKKVVENFVNTL